MRHVPLLLMGIFAAFWSTWAVVLDIPGAVAPSLLIGLLLVLRRAP